MYVCIYKLYVYINDPGGSTIRSHSSGFLDISIKIIIFNTKSIIFDTKSIIFDTKFIDFKHKSLPFRTKPCAGDGIID